MDPGVYFIGEKELKPIPQAEAKVVTSKGRTILKMLSPLPVVATKSTVEIDGERAATVTGNAQPEFYFRMALPERFIIFKLNVKKGSRVVQTWEVMPVNQDLVELQDEVPVLHRQLDDRLYKIWPAEPLKPGEYAVVEYTKGQRNIQIWDFAYNTAVKPKGK
jgi:hypothetical protein